MLFINTLTRLFVFVLSYFVLLFSDAEIRNLYLYCGPKGTIEVQTLTQHSSKKQTNFIHSF